MRIIDDNFITIDANFIVWEAGTENGAHQLKDLRLIHSTGSECAPLTMSVLEIGLRKAPGPGQTRTFPMSPLATKRVYQVRY